METVELKGKYEIGYRLVVRNYDGVEVNYTNIAWVTNREAQSLVNAGYVTFPDSPPLATDELPNPRDILQIENHYIGDTIFKSLHIRLPINGGQTDRRTKAIDFIDPWYESNRSLLDEERWNDYHLSQFTFELGEPEVEEEWWPDNPAEAVAFW